ncbi:MAG: hypothetical protein Kow0047_06820 [Anaerolineae bacterium]
MTGSSNPQIFWSNAYRSVEQDCACASEQDILASPLRQAAAENDCACPSAIEDAEPGAFTTGLWQKPKETYVAPLSPEHRAIVNLRSPAGVVVLGPQAWTVWQRFEAPRPLNGDELAQQLARLGLLEPAEGSERAVPHQSRTLTAWLHVTNACPLACRYCYVEKAADSMDEATGVAAIASLVETAASHGFRRLKLKYAGGEPMIRFDLVQILHDAARRRCDDAKLQLDEVVLTSGVGLTRERLTAIRNADMRVMISLDGLDGGHDAQRPLQSGAGSSPLVIEAVEAALATGVRPHLSITITALNLATLPDVVDFALDRDLPFHFNFYRPPAHQDELEPNHAALIQALRQAFDCIARRPPRWNVWGTLLDRVVMETPHQHACGAGRDYVVIDHRGQVHRCHMDMAHPVGTVQRIDLLEPVRQADAHFANAAVDDRPLCRECRWRYMCAGGCPLMAYRATGRWDARSPYCDVYRALLPDLVRLEGYRLLQMAA